MKNVVFVLIKPGWSIEDLLGRERIRIVESVCKVGRSLTDVDTEVCASALTHEHVIAKAFAGLFVCASAGICTMDKHIEFAQRALEAEVCADCTKFVPDEEIFALLGRALRLLIESSDTFDFPIA